MLGHPRRFPPVKAALRQKLVRCACGKSHRSLPAAKMAKWLTNRPLRLPVDLPRTPPPQASIAPQ
jgi:hypothetical protein